jgi:hypothetical protein
MTDGFLPLSGIHWTLRAFNRRVIDNVHVDSEVPRTRFNLPQHLNTQTIEFEDIFRQWDGGTPTDPGDSSSTRSPHGHFIALGTPMNSYCLIIRLCITLNMSELSCPFVCRRLVGLSLLSLCCRQGRKPHCIFSRSHAAHRTVQIRWIEFECVFLTFQDSCPFSREYPGKQGVS